MWLLLGGHVWLMPGGMCGCSQGVCMVAPGGRGMGACVVALGGVWLLPGGMYMVAPGGVHGCSQGGVWSLWGGRHAWSLPGGHVWLLTGGHAWDMTRYGDTINERAVRILLECILVSRNKISDFYV